MVAGSEHLTANHLSGRFIMRGTNYRRIIAAVVALVALGGATVVTAAPAEAATNYRATAQRVVNGV